MKKLLLSLLCIGFAQGAFGASSKVSKKVKIDPKSIELRPSALSILSANSIFNEAECSENEFLAKFSCDIVIVEKEHKQKIGEVDYFVKKILLFQKGSKFVNQILKKNESDLHRTVFFISGIVINEDYRRKGIASQVVKLLCAQVSKEVKIDSVRARSVLFEAVHFWLNLGFSPMDDRMFCDYCASPSDLTM